MEGDRTGHEHPEAEGGEGHSKVLRFRDFRWKGVPLKEYKDRADHFRAVSRQTLLGEGPGEEPLDFLTRYFEVEPGGYSSLERHEHPHSVVVVRGAGEVVLGGESHPIAPLDCVFVAPGEVHRFRATGDEPLGFLCIVDRERDRPRVVEEDEA